MKISQTIAISATTSSTILIGSTYAPETTYTVFCWFGATALIAMLITCITILIKETI